MKKITLVFALAALLASPFLTVSAASVNTAKPTSMELQIGDTSPVAITRIYGKVAAVATSVGEYAGKKVRKWVSYRNNSLVELSSAILPEGALD